MKTRAILGSLAFLGLGLVMGASARAQEVKGEIKVAGAKTPAGMKCEEIVVEVSSKEQTTAPPGWKTLWFATPKWQRHARASGSWASGTCNYTVKVVAKSDFKVYLAGEPDSACDGYYATSSSPQQSDWIKVAKGESKDQNFKLDEVRCIPIP